MMVTGKKQIILFEMPTLPQGVISLSLAAVAACFSQDDYEVGIIDLNFNDFDTYSPDNFEISKIAFFGLKVSAQNFNLAKRLTEELKKNYSGTLVVWGGELPTLLPDISLQYADTIVQSMFESIADEFIADIENFQIKKRYIGSIDNFHYLNSAPPIAQIKDSSKYYSFMGVPLETSRGCTEKCTFCMVHVMQKKHYHTSEFALVKKRLESYRGHFINVIDYNIGVDNTHLIEVANLIKESGALGWMAEMCIEMLDNEEVLCALQKSNCKIIYCGLETIEQEALNSVHKMNTNRIEEYERIIRKAQKYDIQVASGFILGLKGTTAKTFERALDFFNRVGIVYVKLTFITYNPGTKVNHYMRKKGTYLSDRIEDFDGNHLTYVDNGVDPEEIIVGTKWFIKKFYSSRNIFKRAMSLKLRPLRFIEYVMFNICYRQTYLDWITEDMLSNPQKTSELLKRSFTKKPVVMIAEKILYQIRNLTKPQTFRI